MDLSWEVENKLRYTPETLNSSQGNAKLALIGAYNLVLKKNIFFLLFLQKFGWKTYFVNIVVSSIWYTFKLYFNIG